ncbi:MAG TPA: exo-alpha-sialidase [Clostridiales bacterium]|jgi:predicted neuraminidase|nr:exo-alpha-sialidase [Clostridiales bacterium]
MKLKLLRKELIYPVENAPCPSVHASTLVKMADGRIAAAWFGGTAEKNPDVRIWFSVMTDGIWEAPRAITPANMIADWNPTLYCNENGRLILIYKEGLDPRQWYSMVSYSDDMGKTWSQGEPLVFDDVGGRGPVKNKMIALSDGSLLAPASLEDTLNRWECFADISYDGGKTFEKSATVPMTRPGDDRVYLNKEEFPAQCGGLIQPTAWEEKERPGRVHMLMRSSFSYLYRTDSSDYGKTWSPAYPCGLPNNNSGVDIAQLDNGLLGLIYNPVACNWGLRTPISVSLSDDNAISWKDTLHLETAEGEYSYPAIIPYGDRFCMTYTWKRQTIAYAEVGIE